MDRTRLFESELLPVMKASKSFGAGNFEVLECEVTSESTGGDHFTSSTLFVKLKIQFPDQSPKSHHMVIKLAPVDEGLRKVFQTERLFHNEVTMYSEIIPGIESFLRNMTKVSPDKYDLFPKYYFGRCDNGKEVVAVQDLRPEGFRLCEDRLILDYDHCFIMMETIGRFHSLSYAMKKLAGPIFTSLAKKFKNYKYDDVFFDILLDRVIRHLEETKGLDTAYINNFKKHVKDPIKLMKDLVEPKEPLAVVCHGDFCRNNVLFKYENGKPCDVKLFDFQLAKYASPAIDLSFFCFLNTTSEFRAKHWNNLFQVYHNSLTRSLAEITDTSLEEIQKEFSLDMFLQEFREYCYHGLLLCSFFLPQMMTEPEDQINQEEMSKKSMEELAVAYAKLGGEKASAAVADIVKDMAKMGSF